MAVTYLTLKEASERAGVSPGTMKRLAWLGALKDAVKRNEGQPGKERWEVPARTVSRLEQMGPQGVLEYLRKTLSETRSEVVQAATAHLKPAKPAAPPAKTKKATKPVVNRNQHIVLVMDNSSSMGYIMDRANKEGAKMLAEMTRTMRNDGFDVQVSGYSFGLCWGGMNWGGIRCVNRVSEWAPNLKADTGTPLNDTIALAIEDCGRDERKDESHLILVVTDGEECHSLRHNHSSLGEVVRRAIATDRYTITIAGPASIRDYAKRIGLHAGNVTVWDQTERGVAALASATVTATQSYTAARSAGKTSTKQFFTTDLSGVSERDLKKLTDLSDHFRELKVDKAGPDGKEWRIDEFIESKTKSPLVIGSAYYQLMKPETVQTTKGILIRKKGTKRIYGGAQARRLLALPNYEVKVTPGNHSDYDVFVQSTSVNRKLPRGTTVLWDKTHTTGLKPTWDHTTL